MSKSISELCNRFVLILFFEEPAGGHRKGAPPATRGALAQVLRAISSSSSTGSSGGSAGNREARFIDEDRCTRKQLLRASSTEPDTPLPVLDCLALAAAAATAAYLLLWMAGH